MFRCILAGTGLKNGFEQIFFLKICHKIGKLRSKSGVNMVNATFAQQPQLFTPPVFGMQVWQLSSLPLLHFCDIIVRSEFVHIHFSSTSSSVVLVHAVIWRGSWRSISVIIFKEKIARRTKKKRETTGSQSKVLQASLQWGPDRKGSVLLLSEPAG